MSSSSEYIILLKKILTLLKNSKLEYLKASDESNLSGDKRHFNLQSTLRNRYFQDVIKLLRALDVEVENLITHRLNFEQMVISSIKIPNHTHLNKSIKLDQSLLALYDEALAIDPSNLVLKSQRDKIAESVSEGIYSLENVGLILES